MNEYLRGPGSFRYTFILLIHKIPFSFSIVKTGRPAISPAHNPHLLFGNFPLVSFLGSSWLYRMLPPLPCPPSSHTSPFLSGGITRVANFMISLSSLHSPLENKGHCYLTRGQPIRWAPPSNDPLVPEEFLGCFHGRRKPRRRPGLSPKMIITTWIVYILARKGVGWPFPPKTSSVGEAGGSHAEPSPLRLLPLTGAGSLGTLRASAHPFVAGRSSGGK